MPKRLATFIIFALAIGLTSFFVWRIFFFYQKIEDGTLTAQDLSFTSRLTTSQLVQAVATPTTEVVDVTSDDDPSIGSAEALLTIVEFGDFECPYTKEVSYAARRLASLFGTKVRYIYRDFPLIDVHQDAVRAAEAGECADDQHQFWAYHDKLFQNQDDLSLENLIAIAEQTGLDMAEFETCLADEQFGEEVAEDMAAGIAAGVVGTPTFFFNGRKIEGAIPEDIFEALIESFLSQNET